MAEPKVISINFPFAHRTVVNEPSFQTQRALFDFQVAVVRPYRFHRTGRNSSDQEAADREMRRKTSDLRRLLEQGGLIVVILDEYDSITYTSGSYTHSRSSTTSNYDFLSNKLRNLIQNGHGENLDIIDHSHPFAEVLKKSHVRWTAYFGNLYDFPFEKRKLFATNGANASVGISGIVGNGSVVFLPNLEKLDEPTFFKVCQTYLKDTESTPPPNWAQTIEIPGVQDIDEELTRIDAEIVVLQEERAALLGSKTDLLDYRKLLYEKGKTQLEPVVRKSLNLFGFEFRDNEIVSKETNFEIDGNSSIASEQTAILEVKGSKNVIHFDEVSTFLAKLHAIIKETNQIPKGILVANGLCETDPKDRLGSQVFSSHALTTANGNSISLINSVELFDLVHRKLSGTPLDEDAIRERLLGGQGYVDLRDFGVRVES